MSKVDAWQCKHCGALYLIKTEMEKCRRNCSKMIREQRKEKAKREEADRLANEMRLTVEYVEEIPRIIEQIVEQRFDRTIHITRWDLEFNTRLAPTHDCPIGKRTEFTNVRNYYLGWRGRACGEQENLYKNPVNYSGATFGKIGGFGDLCGRHGVIRGVNTGSGSGGETFSYEVRLYLDDFPKLKEKYELWKPIQEKSMEYSKQRKELISKAHSVLIGKDKRIIDLDDTISLLRVLTKRADERRSQVVSAIKSSQEWASAIEPSDEYKFDKDLLHQLDCGFKLK